MSEEFKQGDRVTWKSHGGNAEARCNARSPRIPSWRAGKMRASKDDPQYLVRSDKSGGEAVHKPSALRKKG